MSPALFLLRKNRAGRTRAGFSLHPLPAAVPRSPIGAAGVEFRDCYETLYLDRSGQA